MQRASQAIKAMQTVRIREECDDDMRRIHDVLVHAFRNYTTRREDQTVENLRKRKILSLGLVATEENRVRGYAAFSPVLISGRDLKWQGLGPVAVDPEAQGRGIGTRLVRTGISMLRQKGVEGCIVCGDPDFFQRFGFRMCLGMKLRHLPFDCVLALTFGNYCPAGSLEYHGTVFY